MRLGLRDIDWAQVGAELAQGDDNNQIEFFKSFVKECLSWGTAHQVEMQLCFINRKLTPKERETLTMLGLEDEKTS